MKAKKVGALLLAAVLTVSTAAPMYAAEAPETDASGQTEQEMDASEKKEAEDEAEVHAEETDAAKEAVKEAEELELKNDSNEAVSEKEGAAEEEKKEEIKAPSSVEKDTSEKETNKAENTEKEEKNEEGQTEEKQSENSKEEETKEEDSEKDDAEAEDQKEAANAIEETEKQEKALKTTSLAADEISIPDENLKNAIRSQLGLEADTPITKEDILKLTELDCSNTEVASLEGLQYAENLTKIVARYCNITDPAPLAGLKKLTQIELPYNQITSISSISSLVETADYIDLSGNQKVVEALLGTYFEKCYSPEGISMMENTTYHYITGKLSKIDWNIHLSYVDMDEKFSVSVDDKNILEATALTLADLGEEDFVETEFIHINLKSKSAGTTFLNITVGGVTKKVPITVCKPEEKVPEENKTENLPFFEGKDANTILHQGSIWYLSGDEKVNVSGDIKVKKYISNSFSKEGKKVTEFTGLDENNTLYYWPALEDGSGWGTPIKIAENVRMLDDENNFAYLDKNNTYHKWEFSGDGENRKPVEVETIENVKEILNDTYFVLSTGKTLRRNNYLGRGEIVDFLDVAIKDICGFYIIDEDNNLKKYTWQVDDKTYLLEDIDTGVSQIGNSFYLKGDKIYSYEGMLIDTGVTEILEFGYYMKGKDTYFCSVTNGSIKTSFYAENARVITGTFGSGKSMLGVLTEDGELWVGGLEKGYLYLTSVKEVYPIEEKSTYHENYEEKYIAVREDGSMWLLDPPLKPYVIFVPEGNTELEIWTDTDEATGISATGEGIRENVTLNAKPVGADAQGYEADYQRISEYMAERMAKAFTVFDIKLIDEQGNSIQPEAGKLVTVTVPLPEGYSSNVRVYHRSADGEMSILTCSVNGQSVAFQTDGFSLFTIADFGEKETEDPANPENPQNPENPVNPEAPQNPENPGTSGNGTGSNSQANGNNTENNVQGTPVSNTVKAETRTSTDNRSTQTRSVNTGDNTQVELWLCLFALAGVCIGNSVRMIRKRR